MVNSKLQGEGPHKQVRIVWTAAWVEPGDKWVIVTILVTITQGWSPLSPYQPLLTLYWVLGQMRPGQMSTQTNVYLYKCLSVQMSIGTKTP